MLFAGSLGSALQILLSRRDRDQTAQGTRGGGFGTSKAEPELRDLLLNHLLSLTRKGLLLIVKARPGAEPPEVWPLGALFLKDFGGTASGPSGLFSLKILEGGQTRAFPFLPPLREGKPGLLAQPLLTGRFSLTASTGCWKGHANWCFHNVLSTTLSRYCSWLVWRLGLLGLEVSGGGGLTPTVLPCWGCACACVVDIWVASSPSPITGRFLSLVPGPLSADMLLIPLHSSPDTLQKQRHRARVTSQPAFTARSCLKTNPGHFQRVAQAPRAPGDAGTVSKGTQQTVRILDSGVIMGILRHFCLARAPERPQPR